MGCAPLSTNERQFGDSVSKRRRKCWGRLTVCKRCTREFKTNSGNHLYCSHECRTGRVTKALVAHRMKQESPFQNKTILRPSSNLKTYNAILIAKSRPPQTFAQKERVKQYQSGQDFYQSQAWRMLRFEAFIKYGRRCMCCGAKPPQVILHVDHVKPRSQYPELELDIRNVQILCEVCNIGKSNRHQTDFRK